MEPHFREKNPKSFRAKSQLGKLKALLENPKASTPKSFPTSSPGKVVLSTKSAIEKFSNGQKVILVRSVTTTCVDFTLQKAFCMLFIDPRARHIMGQGQCIESRSWP